MVGSQERPQERQKAIFPERVVTERVVTIALMGVGLKLERPLGGNAWGPAWRLLGVTMVLRMLLSVIVYAVIVHGATAPWGVERFETDGARTDGERLPPVEARA
jgi:NhaP-type Na+/H+ or K+/H+ antiporter